MITERHDIDLNLLKDHFTVDYDYSIEDALEELESIRKEKGLYILVSENDGIDGFLIGYVDRDRLWLSQIWRKPGSDIFVAVEALSLAKNWARKRGLRSIMGETRRDEFRAMKRFGFLEYKVVMKCRLDR